MYTANGHELRIFEFPHPSPLPKVTSIYTSTGSFSLEGEGWDEGDINGCFYSPLPLPLQQERERDRFVTFCICNTKSCVDTYARRERGTKAAIRARVVPALPGPGVRPIGRPSRFLKPGRSNGQRFE